MIAGALQLHLPRKTVRATVGHVELMGARSGALTQAHGRIILISLIFALLYLVMAIRAFDLMILQGEMGAYRDRVENQGHDVVATAAVRRRDIVDRSGNLLATSIKTASLYADPHNIIDANAAAKGVAAIFSDLSYGEVLQKLQSDKRFVWIRRNLTPTEQARILELGQPGLAFQEEYRRIYPQGNLTAHLIGYSGVDDHGLSGVEQGFDKTLSAGGDDPLALTVDIRLQHILRREIQKTVTDFTAQAGSGLIMDIQSGEILAAVSLPDFDPHAPMTAQDSARFNRVTLGTYELGSCFKIFSTAALLEQQHPGLGTTFDARTPIKIGRFTINDYHPENRDLTIPEVFMYSSNIGTARMGQAIGTDNLRDFYAQLGLLDPVPFDLPEVGRPQVPKPWGEVSTLTASYGHGIAVTPLHLAVATATVIGDGHRVTPRLIMPATTHKSRRAAPEGARVVSDETVRAMRSLLRVVVQHGTGSKAEVPGFLVGGKTGTAEKSINGRYVAKALISSFVGVFPMDQPKYLIVVSIDDPKPNKSSFGYATAGWTAAPAVARVVASMAGVLGLQPRPDASDPAAPLLPYLAEFRDKVALSSAPAKGDARAALTAVVE